MTATGLEVFDKTLQTTNVWLDDIGQTLGPDRQVAWKALSVVLHALRDRMPVELSAHLGAELPLLVRGAYYDQFTPERQPTDWNRDDFVAEVADGLSGIRPVNAQDATQAVFGTISRHLPCGQVEKVQEALPGDLQAMWSSVDERAVPPGG